MIFQDESIFLRILSLQNCFQRSMEGHEIHEVRPVKASAVSSAFSPCFSVITEAISDFPISVTARASSFTFSRSLILGRMSFQESFHVSKIFCVVSIRVLSLTSLYPSSDAAFAMLTMVVFGTLRYIPSIRPLCLSRAPNSRERTARLVSFRTAASFFKAEVVDAAKVKIHF